MRTFITSFLFALATALWAQSSAPDTSITYVGTVIPYDPPHSADYTARCYNTWHRVKPYMSLDTVRQYCPNLVNIYGADTAYYLLMALFANEGQGSVTDTSGGGHGFAHIHETLKYAEYMDKGKDLEGFLPYKFSELDDPMNIRFTLATVNYQFSPQNPAGYATLADRWMAWNVGKAGLSDEKKKKRREDYFHRLEAFFESLVYLGGRGFLHWA